MKPAYPLVAALALFAISPTEAAEPPAGKVHSGKVELATPKKTKDKRAGNTDLAPFSIFVPDGVETIRGVVFNPFYEKTVEQKHWRTAAAHWDFALMGANLFGVRANDIGQVTLDGLVAMAKETGHPEIANAPLCLVGMSAGGGMSMSIAAAIPDRVIAAAPVCLEVGPKNEASHQIPILTIFGERDGKQMEKLSAKLPVARKENAKWGIAVQWGRKHEFHYANNLAMPFFDAVIANRYPPTLDPLGGPPKLLPNLDRGAWLGAKDEWGEEPAELRPWMNVPAAFAKKTTCWFPNSYVAHTWQAFVIKKPKLRIKSPPGLGGQPFIIHPAGTPIKVEFAVAKGLVLEKLELRLGDRIVAACEPGSTQLRLPALDAGIHALIAVGTDTEGKRYLSIPHTILVVDED